MNRSTYCPGVYSQYTVQTLYSGRRDGVRVALVGRLGLDEPLTAVKFAPVTNPLPQGASPLLKNLWSVCFGAGAGELTCVSLPDEPAAGDFQRALGSLEEAEVYTVACQYLGEEEARAAADWALSQSDAQKERLVFIGLDDPAESVRLAKALNCERAVLTLGAPSPDNLAGGDPFYGAAALAAGVAAAEDPSVSLSSLELPGLALTSPLAMAQCDLLLEAGVVPLVGVGDHVECLRGVTTRTADGALADRSLYPLSAILIIDYVMRSLRGTLAGLLKGAKNGGGTLSAVASQVTVLLSGLTQRGIITGFSAPNVYTPGEDPGRCVVEVAFGAAYTINQICITAQVQL